MNESKLLVVIPYFNHTNARVNRRLLEESLERLSHNPDCLIVLAEGIWNGEAELDDYSHLVHRHLKCRYPQALWFYNSRYGFALESVDAWRDVSYATEGTIRLQNARLTKAIEDSFLLRKEHLLA